MTAAGICLWLYVFGFMGLNAMSHDYSNLPRTRRVWLRLIFWPVVVPAAWVGDLWDAASGIVARWRA